MRSVHLLEHRHVNLEKDPKESSVTDSGWERAIGDWKNWNKGVWNTDDHRLFPPKRIGIGWTINIHELLRRLRVVG